ncbi:MAG TPA: PIG-L family deacetylase [Planctomycetota bacterium]|nr:PIG-L family deacetylase [Planctomycetota bacterium]
MTQRWRILCFGAHPDDLETYVGASLMELARLGHELVFVLASDGEAGTLQPATGTRIDEQLAALSYFEQQTGQRPSLERLRRADAKLVDDCDLPRVCAAAVTAWDPDCVIAPSEGDAHADHRAVARALAGIDLPVLQWLDAAANGATHVLPLSSAAHELKRAWIRQHASQLPKPSASREHLPGGLDLVERIVLRDRRFGLRSGHDYAEPLRVEVSSAHALQSVLDELGLQVCA